MNDYVVNEAGIGRRGKVIRALWLVVLAVIVGAGAAGGVYVWQQHDMDALHRQVSALNSQVNTLQAQLQTAQKPQQPSASQPAPAAPSYAYTSAKGVQVKVYAPANNAKVASPVPVVGEVPGSWSFEAQFPVKLKDGSGAVVAQGTAQVLGDWTTSQLVPFSAKLTYTTAPTGSGTLVLQKDNPSGLAQNDDTVSIPVRF